LEGFFPILESVTIRAAFQATMAAVWHGAVDLRGRTVNNYWLSSPRELAPIQQLIADEISDLLVHCGCADAVENLLMAAGCHSVWRWAVNLFGPDEQENIGATVMDRGEANSDEWYADLTAEWKRNRKAAPDGTVEPKTATKGNRGSYMDELRERFESFLTESTPEEQMILSDGLLAQHSTNRGLGRDSFNELPLGIAMEEALDKYTGDFLRVPHQFEKQVQQYIDCLRAADGEGVA
jgi:hypothetical protein